MQREDFERLANTKVSDKEYQIIETVYLYHPAIGNGFGKAKIVELYTKFGMTVICDMYPRAHVIKTCRELLEQKEIELEDLRKLKERFEAVLITPDKDHIAKEWRCSFGSN